MMNLKPLKLLSPALLMMLIACGGSATTTSSLIDESGSSAAAYAETTIEGVTSFTISSSGPVSIENLSSDSQYMLAVYNSQTATSSTGAWTAGGENLPSALVKATGDDVTEEIHERLRANEEVLDPAEVMSAPATKQVVRALETGSSRSFKVLNSLSGTGGTSTVTATLRYTNADVYVYVDDRNQASLSNQELAQVMDTFSDRIDDEQELFGSESDVNGDGHFVVLMTQAVNELGASGGGFLTGYFYALDLFPADTYEGSNEMEIIYSMVPDPKGAFGVPVSREFSVSNILPSVLPHEFQHMINYNQHVLVREGSSEASFLNEALSHLAEDIYSRNASGYMETSGIENPSRVALYLDETSSVCFSCGASLVQRGGSYLFIRYLYEQAQKGNLTGAASGAALIRNLEETTSTGVTNIMAAALSANSAEFSDLLSRFSMALYLSGSSSISDSRYTLSGLNLHESQEDNRGTVLAGPAVTANTGAGITAVTAASGISYVKLSGQEIKDGTLTLNFAAGMQGGGFLLTIAK